MGLYHVSGTTKQVFSYVEKHITFIAIIVHAKCSYYHT